VAPAALLTLGALAVLESLQWRGARFPGFFLMPNRVVPSVALPRWSGVGEGRPLYQQVLLAVDDVPVGTAAEGYLRAAERREGDTVRCLFADEGRLRRREVALRTLSDGAFLAIFGTYALTGLAYLLLGAVATRRWHQGSLYRALAAVGWVGAAFAFTAIDLYGPGRVFRLHALAEACLPAAMTHLALVWPRDHLAARPGLLRLVYGLALALGAAYEIFLFEPAAYSTIHNLCQALAAVPVLALAGMVALEDGYAPEAAHRRPLAVALAGIVLPAIVFGVSGVTGGDLPVNASAWVAFLFPLGWITALRQCSAARPPGEV
jgi:hypothetical protein